MKKEIKKLTAAREFAERFDGNHRSVVYDAQTRKSINAQIFAAYFVIFELVKKDVAKLSAKEKYKIRDEFGNYPGGANYKGTPVKNECAEQDLIRG